MLYQRVDNGFYKNNFLNRRASWIMTSEIPVFFLLFLFLFLLLLSLNMSTLHADRRNTFLTTPKDSDRSVMAPSYRSECAGQVELFLRPRSSCYLHYIALCLCARTVQGQCFTRKAQTSRTAPLTNRSVWNNNLQLKIVFLLTHDTGPSVPYEAGVAFTDGLPSLVSARGVPVTRVGRLAKVCIRKHQHLNCRLNICIVSSYKCLHKKASTS